MKEQVAYSRKDWGQVAQLAQIVGNTNRMQIAVRQIIRTTLNQESYLNEDEQYLFSYVFKKRLDSLKVAYRLIREAESKNIIKPNIIQKQKNKILEQALSICDQVIQLTGSLASFLQNKQIQYGNQQAELSALTFYYKINGDYHRYKLDFTSDDNQKKAYCVRCKQAYEKAGKYSLQLDAKNVTRLGLALNFSLFIYNIEQNPGEACQQALKAIQQAKKSNRKASKKQSDILKRLNANINLWSSNDEKFWDQSKN